MAWTRAQVESVIVGRTAGMLVACYIATSPATDPAPRSYMNDPLREALNAMGYPILVPSAVADGDFLGLLPGDENPLFKVSELRTLETCLNQLDDVSFSQGPEKIALGELGVRLEKRIEKIRHTLQMEYGIGLMPLVAGVINLNNIEQYTGPNASIPVQTNYTTE